MSQTTIANSTAVDAMFVQACPSSIGQESYLTLRGDGTASKPSHPATDASQYEPRKTTSTNILTKTRNWMAHTLSWQTAKAFFEGTLTKTNNFLARIFSQQKVKSALACYEEKSHDVGAASRTACHNIYKQVTTPADTTMHPSGRDRRTRSWAARNVRTALLGAAAVVRVLWATGKMALDVAIGGAEIAGAGFIYAIDQI